MARKYFLVGVEYNEVEGADGGNLECIEQNVSEEIANAIAKTVEDVFKREEGLCGIAESTEVIQVIVGDIKDVEETDNELVHGVVELLDEVFDADILDPDVTILG